MDARNERDAANGRCVEKARIRRRAFGAMTRAMRERGSNTLGARLGNARRSDATCVFVDEPSRRGDERAFQLHSRTRDRGGERK